MQIQFIGTGGAFEPEFGNSAAIIELNGKKILLDCGFTVYPFLKTHNLIQEIDYVLLTHLHNDHCGSLANLLLHFSVYIKSKKPVVLFASENQKKDIFKFLEIQVKEPDNYADFKPLQEVEGITAIDSFGKHSENFQSYSFIFTEGSERIIYSGDLAQPEALFDNIPAGNFTNQAVYHDITFNNANTGHTHYTKLKPYQQQYNIYGYHCNPTENPADNTIPLVYNQPGLVLG